MTKRQCYLLLAITLLGGCILGAFLIYQRSQAESIRYDRFDQIRQGMTDVEVEALLGCPPGDYRTGEVHVGKISMIIGHTPTATSKWQGDQGDLIVDLDENNRVICHWWLRGTRVYWWLKFRARYLH